ncbi:chaperone NapD [Sutterella sp.]|uniref:chaperone NapD n=1 Tax=Sutterella sp. TaxID=1981025 RepID=UPI0026E0F8C8|nr:chaperone NapD [Sutterella sp.]MDO5530494.1 chaperone NapD [Sutterella sp.]
MNYSAILVVVHPGRLEDALRAVKAIEGVEPHQTDPATGRMICTIEAPTTDDEVRLFRTVADLPDVFDVSLIEHRPDAS